MLEAPPKPFELKPEPEPEPCEPRGVVPAWEPAPMPCAPNGAVPIPDEPNEGAPIPEPTVDPSGAVLDPSGPLTWPSSVQQSNKLNPFIAISPSWVSTVGGHTYAGGGSPFRGLRSGSTQSPSKSAITLQHWKWKCKEKLNQFDWIISDSWNC